MKRQHEDEVRRLLQSVRPDTTPPPGCQERTLDRLLAHIKAREGRQLHEGGGIGKHRLILGTTAAAVVLITIAGWWFLLRGVPAAAATFGDMLRKVRQASTASYNLACRLPGQPEHRGTVVTDCRGRTRVTWADGRVQIVGGGPVMLVLTPAAKTARKIVARGAPYDQPLERLRNLGESAGEFVGMQTFNSRRVAVYRVQYPAGTMQIWVDMERGLPIRIEATTPAAEGPEAVMVFDDIRWNVRLADSLFSLEPPPGYRLEQPEQEPSEAALIELLSVCAKLAGGSFPETLDPRSFVSLFISSRPGQSVASPDGGVAATDFDEETKESYRTCLRGLAFIEKVSQGGTWRYAGQGVKLGDGTTPVCWWTVGSVRRVIYGDLQVENATPDSGPLLDNDSHPPQSWPPAGAAGP